MNTEKKIFLTLAIVFLLFMNWAGWNETAHFALTRAITEEGRLEITSFAEETGDRIRIGNHYYLDKAPGLSFLAVPIHAFSVLIFSTDRPTENKKIFVDGYYFLKSFPAEYLLEYKDRISFDMMLFDNKYGIAPIVMPFFIIPTHLSLAERFSMIMSTFFLSGLATVGTAYLLFIFSKEFIEKKNVQYFVPIGYALGTLAFSQALVFQRHAATAFFCFAAFFVGYYTIKKGYFSIWRGGILSGFLGGIGFLVDPLALFAIIGIGLWFILSRSPKFFLWYGFVFITIAAIILVYNIIAFGTPFFISYSAYALSFTAHDNNLGIEILPKLKEFFFRYFHPSLFDFHIATIIRLLIMPERGMFFYSPFLFLIIPGAFFLVKKRPALMAMVLFIFFSLIWFVSMPYVAWWGNASFVPRYVTLAMPFLMIPIIFAIGRVHIFITFFLITVSIFINILGLQNPSFVFDVKIADMNTEEYRAAIASLNVIDNPLTSYYWPRFMEYGINMPIVQGVLAGRSLDIRNYVPLDDYDYRIMSTPFGSLFASRPVIPFLVMTLILSFIWFGRLRNTFWKYPLITGIIILAIFSFRLG